MSATEQALELVRHLDEDRALRLIEWLRNDSPASPPEPMPAGAEAVLGCARRFHARPKSTAKWIRELRQGELD
jgi:hypothetical protein